MNLLSSICTAAIFSASVAALAQAPARVDAPRTPSAKPAPRSAVSPARGTRALPDTPGPRTREISPAGVRLPSASYRLSPGDTVKLSVFNEPKLDDEGTLSNSGEVSFPLIGSVVLAGKTIREAEDAIEFLYNRDYLVDPRVTLALTGYAQHSVTISGAVATPGAIPIPQDGRLDVLGAIAAAGGVAENANLRDVILRPAAGGASIHCDITAMQANPSLSRQLKPGDSLTVSYLPQKVARWVNVMGEVKSPAPVEVPDGGRIDVLTAIASAGGYSRIANPKKVTVIRPGAAGKQIFPLNAAAMADGSDPLFYLMPGDTLTVSESKF